MNYFFYQFHNWDGEHWRTLSSRFSTGHLYEARGIPSPTSDSLRRSPAPEGLSELYALRLINQWNRSGMSHGQFYSPPTLPEDQMP